MEENSVNKIIEIQRTWQKIENTSRKAGLREGISNGRDRNFQEYFDIGFKEGFKNGYVLGKYKGTLLAHSRHGSLELVKNPFLDKIERGGCEICRNEDLLKKDVQEIIRNQTELSNKNLTELYASCNNIFECQTLPNKLS